MAWWLSTLEQFSIAHELITNLLLVIRFLKHLFQLFLNPRSSLQDFDIKILFIFVRPNTYSLSFVMCSKCLGIVLPGKATDSGCFLNSIFNYYRVFYEKREVY